MERLLVALLTRTSSSDSDASNSLSECDSRAGGRCVLFWRCLLFRRPLLLLCCVVPFERVCLVSVDEELEVMFAVERVKAAFAVPLGGDRNVPLTSVLATRPDTRCSDGGVG